MAFDCCVLGIHLDPGNGKADWKINRAIGQLQRHVNMAYQLAKYGDPYAHLTDFERERLSLAVEIGVGSTVLGIDLAKSLGSIQNVLPAHWSPRARSIVTVGAFLAIVSLPYVTEFRTYRSAIDTTQITAVSSLEAVDRTNRANIEIVQIQANANIAVAKVQADVAATSSKPLVLALARPVVVDPAAVVLAHLAQTDPSRVVWFATSDLVSWRPALLDLAPFSGTIRWNGSIPIPASVAKAMAKSTRAEATRQRRVAKDSGQRGIINTPWVTEVLRTHQAPGAMRLGVSEA